MKRLTAEWVRKAEADYAGAQNLRREGKALRDLVCFHCQQCAEKYLKGLLQELGLSVPRTHDLEHLFGLLLHHHASLRPVRRGMRLLTRFSVETRYPREWATQRDAEAAFRWADRTRTAARAILGLGPRRPRGKR